MPDKHRDSVHPDPVQEWQECRVTAGRFDGYLEDTRKYGFTLVTLLLAANAVVVPAAVRPAAAIMVLALLLALFMIDNFYWVMLKAAVKRAIALEGAGQISSVLKKRATDSHVTELVLAFYGLFVLIAGGVPIITILASDSPRLLSVLVIVVAVLIVGSAMALVYVLVEPNSSPSVAVRKTLGMNAP
jgi:hypothetical protein